MFSAYIMVQIMIRVHRCTGGFFALTDIRFFLLLFLFIFIYLFHFFFFRKNYNHNLPTSKSKKHTFPTWSKATVSGVTHKVWNISGELLTTSRTRQHSRHRAHNSSSGRQESLVTRTSDRLIVSSAWPSDVTSMS